MVGPPNTHPLETNVPSSAQSLVLRKSRSKFQHQCTSFLARKCKTVNGGSSRHGSLEGAIAITNRCASADIPVPVHLPCPHQRP